MTTPSPPPFAGVELDSDRITAVVKTLDVIAATLNKPADMQRIVTLSAEGYLVEATADLAEAMARSNSVSDQFYRVAKNRLTNLSEATTRTLAEIRSMDNNAASAIFTINERLAQKDHPEKIN